jgi:hypothetical protein
MSSSDAINDLSEADAQAAAPNLFALMQYRAQQRGFGAAAPIPKEAREQINRIYAQRAKLERRKAGSSTGSRSRKGGALPASPDGTALAAAVAVVPRAPASASTPERAANLPPLRAQEAPPRAKSRRHRTS